MWRKRQGATRHLAFLSLMHHTTLQYAVESFDSISTTTTGGGGQCTRGMHMDGFLVPSPLVPTDFFVTERKVVIPVTIVAKLVIY